MARGVSGASLIEMLVSLSVLTIILLAVFTLFPSSALSLRKTEVELQAHAMSERLLEQKRCTRFSDLVAGTVESPAPLDVGAVRLQPTVEILAGTGARTRKVRVKVAWTAFGVSRELVRSVMLCDVKR